ncbi:hypothetical protein A3709_20675 [Halioglobus sp. HI00S01]|uniref:replication initiation protein n=1 Tax=Halioglobus sp. HI00S01 TaxID=1822214 RepID=UPI0007C22AA3|nr:replication initiation protein [Halioglobus sp. HI00S01]KZX58029.1 hypothetical protein A3709_20675 [Halioglobus sp. HI00S01]
MNVKHNVVSHSQIAGEFNKDNLVAKSNALARAHSTLSRKAQLLTNVCISRLNPGTEEPPENTLYKVVLSGQELAQAMEVRIDNLHRKIPLLCSELSQKSICVSRDDISYEWIPIAYKINWDSSVKEFALTFHPDLNRDLIGILKGHFAMWPLREETKFKSQYTGRLFQVLLASRAPLMIKLWDQEEPRSSLLWSLGIRDHQGDYTVSSLKEWRRVREKVLEPAIAEINNHSSINIYEVDYFKRGRQVVAVKFSYKKTQLIPKTGKSGLELLDHLKINEDQKKKILEDFTEEVIRANTKYILERVGEGNVRSHYRYARKILEINAAQLPTVASPMAKQYRGDSKEVQRAFVEHVLAANWWSLTEQARTTIVDLDFHHPVVERYYTEWKLSCEAIGQSHAIDGVNHEKFRQETESLFNADTVLVPGSALAAKSTRERTLDEDILDTSWANAE